MEEVAPGLWLQGGLGFQEAEKRALSTLFYVTRTPHPGLYHLLSFILTPRVLLPLSRHPQPHHHRCGIPPVQPVPHRPRPPSCVPHGVLELALSSSRGPEPP